MAEERSGEKGVGIGRKKEKALANFFFKAIKHKIELLSFLFTSLAS